VTAFLATSASTDTLLSTGETIYVDAIVDKKVTKGSTFTATLDTSTATGGDAAVTFRADADGYRLSMYETANLASGSAGYTVQAGDSITAAKIVSFGSGSTTLSGQYTSGGLANTTVPTLNVSAVDADAIAGLSSADTDVTNINYVEGDSYDIDAVAPDTLLLSAQYDSANDMLIIKSQADNVATTAIETFADLGFSTGSANKIEDFLDWTKLKWIIDEGASEEELSFNDAAVSTETSNSDSSKVSLAYLQSDTELRIVLKDTHAASLEAKADFANLGSATSGAQADAVKIFEGFIKDKAGNSADLDSDGTVAASDYVIFSATSEPTSAAADDTSTDTTPVPLTYVTTNLTPDVTAFLATSASTDTLLSTGETIYVDAIVDKKVTKGSTFTATLDTADGNASQTAQNAVVTFRADADGYRLSMYETTNLAIGSAGYTVKSGQNVEAFKVLSFGSGSTTLSGQYTSGGLANTTVPTLNVSAVDADAIAGLSSADTDVTNINYAEGDSYAIDAVASSVSISTVSYNAAQNKVILKGTGFDTIGVASGTDFSQYLGQNDTAMTWDTGGAGTQSDFVSIGASQISTAKINGETIEIVLDSTFANDTLEKTSVTGKYAGSDADKLSIEGGFFSDVNGNIGSETLSATAIDFSDKTGPTISDVITDGTDGQTYRSGSSLTVTAEFNEQIASGSSITLKLNSEGSVTLSTLSGTDKLTGTYTIGATDAATKLDVREITSASTQDIYGNPFAVGDGKIAGSANISNDQSIKISNVKIADILSNVGDAAKIDAGDKLIFRFSDTQDATAKAALAASVKTALGSADSDLAWNTSSDLLTATIVSIDTAQNYVEWEQTDTQLNIDLTVNSVVTEFAFIL